MHHYKKMENTVRTVLTEDNRIQQEVNIKWQIMTEDNPEKLWVESDSDKTDPAAVFR